ncbi:MAG: DUF4019 domain-containing protein [Halieaceae bacterium]|jgi:hypothetical protein|nr:DUF4019 domain-containing protein [Halieaceae bacterium]
MKFIPSLALALMISFTTHAQVADKEQPAQQAAMDWLAKVDAGEYAASWESAAALLKNQVSAEQWATIASAARKPLGAVQSRELVNVTVTNSLPGAPDGEYVVLQFQTVFDNKASATELLTPMLDNGQWRVSGYFVR